MLEVISYTVKLFPPSGAHACSPLPGSPLRAARFRANLTQAAVAPVFPEPVFPEPMVSEPMVPAPVGRKRPAHRAFYARCIRRGAWRQGPTTLHASRSSRAA
jgi:hypothetical protein